MKPSERLKEIEKRINKNSAGMRYCASGEETEFLFVRVKKLTEVLEWLCATNAIKQPYEEVVEKALDETGSKPVEGE